ncbi:MAG: 6-carboxytetrahydropterin synthase [Planctomycetota bacterium]|nr:MAG: 6-carboxytetrahydropterin synthase [Planctomycetota bacterium]
MPHAALPFAIEVEYEFAAAHAIVIAGERERMHGHNWRVVVSVGGERLDGEELLCDFHQIAHMLKELLEPFSNGSLNDIPPFDRINPTAEALAQFVAQSLATRLVHDQPSVQVEWVRVTEAPRCTAVVRVQGRHS